MRSTWRIESQDANNSQSCAQSYLFPGLWRNFRVISRWRFSRSLVYELPLRPRENPRQEVLDIACFISVVGRQADIRRLPKSNSGEATPEDVRPINQQHHIAQNFRIIPLGIANNQRWNTGQKHILPLASVGQQRFAWYRFIGHHDATDGLRHLDPWVVSRHRCEIRRQRRQKSEMQYKCVGFYNDLQLRQRVNLRHACLRYPDRLIQLHGALKHIYEDQLAWRALGGDRLGHWRLRWQLRVQFLLHT